MQPSLETTPSPPAYISAVVNLVSRSSTFGVYNVQVYDTESGGRPRVSTVLCRNSERRARLLPVQRVTSRAQSEGVAELASTAGPAHIS